MEVIVTDPGLAQRLIKQRQEWGADRFDEVWDGTYVLAPVADDTHQDIQASLGALLLSLFERHGGAHVYMGVNVSDRIEGWEENYRWPDVAVYLPDTKARECAGATLTSEVLPLSFRLLPGPERPTIEVRHRETGQTWMV